MDSGGPKEPRIRWVQIPLCERAIWKGKRAAVSCTKMADPIKMPFGVLTPVGSRKHVLDGVHIGTTWRIRMNRS